MTDGKVHSLIGASSSKRWMTCPGSVKMSRMMPPQGSTVYAEEGTAAHELAEFCLNNRVNPLEKIGSVFNDYEVTEEMAEAVQIYYDTVIDEYQSTEGAELCVERGFKLDHLHPELFGTNDACIIEPFKLLRVFDYKHGVGIPVTVENNPQLLYYALGALSLCDVPEVELIIVQPRCKHPQGPVRRWRTTTAYIKQFEAELMAAVRRTESNNPHFEAGDHCRFCPAAGACPTLRDLAQSRAMVEFSSLPANTESTVISLPDVQTLSNSEIAKIVSSEKLIVGFFAAAKRVAESRVISGEEIPGYKVVRKRAHRRWVDEDTVKEMLDGEDIFTTPKLKSPAQVEKQLGKEAIRNLVITPDNGFTIAPIHDDRDNVNPKDVFDHITPEQLTNLN